MNMETEQPAEPIMSSLVRPRWSMRRKAHCVRRRDMVSRRRSGAEGLERTMREATVLTTPNSPVVKSEVLVPVTPIERKMVGELRKERRGQLESGRGRYERAILVIYRVNTRSVLPHEQRSSTEHAAEQVAPAEEVADRGEEARADGGAVVLDLEVDVVDLLDHVRVVVLQLAQVAQVLDRLVAAAARDEPARRLLDEEGDADREQAAGDELDGEGLRAVLRRQA